MSESRLSLSRYGVQPIFLSKASDLFANRNEILNPNETLPRLLSDFKRLFEQTQDPTNSLYDTVLVCECHSKFNPVYCQRQLLIARSAFFENLFLNSESSDCEVTEDEHGVVTIKFIEEFYFDLEVSLLRELVTYMYWGYWEPRNTERTKQVFELAAKLDLKELRNNASDELAKALSPTNAAELLISAQQYGGRSLKKKSIQFIIENKGKIDDKYLEEKLLSYAEGAKLIAEIYKEDVYTKTN